MSRKLTTTVALSLLSILGMAAPVFAEGAGTGFHAWSISASSSDPTQNTGPDFTSSPSTLYLHLVESCAASAGVSAAEMGIKTQGTLVFLAFNVTGNWLNAGSGANLLLAVGGCPTSSLAGSFLLLGTSGGVWLGPTTNRAATVDCAATREFYWPDEVRFTGFQTASSTFLLQRHGNGCTANAVEDASWTAVKALYR
jgi:hypothetical protein